MRINIFKIFSDLRKEKHSLYQEVVRLRSENKALNEAREKLTRETMELTAERGKLYSENQELSIKVATLSLNLLETNVKDPAPTDSLERKEYVEKVAIAHAEILRPKLKQMIARCQADLSNTGNTRDADLEIKGAIFALNEIILWGDLMESERLSNLQSKTEDTYVD